MFESQPHAELTEAAALIGTEYQVEWAERIRVRVAAEFARVAAAFQSVGGKQSEERRAETAAILVILEDKRAEVMSRREAGYFIRDWQEISDQVRQMIGRDIRYRAIQSKRATRQRVGSALSAG